MRSLCFYLYISASALTFLVYLVDKSAARNRRWRIPEKTLHVLGLAGGWPGALIAQQMLRHKTSKPSFQMIFWVTVVVNCSALAWLLSPSGSKLLHLLP